MRALAGFGQLARAQRHRFHGKRFHHHVADAGQHFLLLLEGRQVFLISQTREQQPRLLGVVRQPGLFRQRTVWNLVKLGLAEDFRQHSLRRLHQRQRSLGGALQHDPGDQQPVDLVGAFENPVDARIAIGALYRVILVKSVAAVDLHAFVHHVVEHFRRVHLDDRALRGELFHRLHLHPRRVRLRPRKPFQQGLNLADHAVAHRLGGEGPDRHLRQLVLDQAELRDGRPERFPLLGVLDGKTQYVLRCAHRERAQLQPAEIQDVERDDMAAADLAQNVLDRDRYIVQVDGRGRAAFDPHLLFFGAGLDAGEPALHQKSRELFASYFGEDRKEVGLAAVGDPHFLAVQNVMRPIGRKIGSGFDGQRVRPGLRLAQTIRADHFRRRQLGQVFLFLLFGAEQQQWRSPDAGMRAVPGGIGTIAREVLGGDHQGRQIQFHPAVPLRCQNRRQSQLGRFLQRRHRQVVIAVDDLIQIRHDLLVPELVGGASNRAMLLGQVLRRENLLRRALLDQEGAAFRLR